MKTILVVEDEFAIAELVSTLLEESGYQVTIARDGREGVRLLSQTRPDLVLCDLMMPVVDGWGVCRAMRANPAHDGVPLVFMSARAVPPTDTSCAYAAFLAKPFEPEALLSLVADLIGPANSG